MSLKKSLAKLALNDPKTIERNEEFNNFMKKVGEVSKLVKDLASGDKEKADKAQALADQYLDGKGEVDKEAWMAEVSRDAERRYEDRKIRREKADTLKTRATKAFRRQEYDKALSCYNQAIEHVRDDPLLYCDRALTNIKLGKFEKVYDDCYWAIRLNEKSFKARLYKARAHKELEEMEKFEECRKELDEMFPQHKDLIKYFLDKKIGHDDDDED
ncbi:tetratricopeptide repeat protein 12 isoform X2 [Anticarsia gemmatalis]|uniref:tetratricopeptide repeat protein 12 isoform X2 n=1 Tax=Anticarsia gemmatalis TaxID=129554 RepID=UPI003F7577C9